MYEILCAIFYVLHNGCAWRNLPHDFPAWQTVYTYFVALQRHGSWAAINHFLVRRTRKQAGKPPEPSAVIIDAQTVRCGPQAGPRGIDAGKRINGRKRHVAVDSMGLLLVVRVTAANIQDRSGGFPLLEQTYNRFPRIRHVWADAGYTGQLVRWARETLGWTMDIVKGVVGQRGFVVQPRRWVVERSLAWLTRSRRLSRDYEILPQTTEAWFYLANIRLMLRRLERSV